MPERSLPKSTCENFMTNLPCIGLFGTCGSSRWREPFVARYNELGIRYFNPQVPDWKPEFAEIEIQHFKRDEIILCPITGETYGTGSLSETGFSLLQAVTMNATRFVVFMIEMEVADHLKENETAYQESLRGRRLVAAHLRENTHPNVFMAASLDDMLAISLRLHDLIRDLLAIRSSCG
jgi:hypothetical protein